MASIPDVDPQDYARDARLYVDAAECLDRSASGSRFLAGPTVVCLSFAAELALKALWRKNGKSITRTHDLLLLFDELPKDQQARIEAEVMAILPTLEHDRLNVLATFRAMGGDPVPPDLESALSATSFRERLGASKHAFPEWRYKFQQLQLLSGEPNLHAQLAKSALRLLVELDRPAVA